MFGCESGNTLITEILFRQAECIADRIEARVEHADDVPRVCLLEDLAVAGHQLLRLGQPLHTARLHVPDFHADFVAAGTDAHECDPVPVRLVHICLDLEYKG